MLRCNFTGKNRKRGLFFCIEMDTRQSYARISSQMSNVPLAKYINGKNNPPSKAELSRVMENFGEISKEFPESWFVEGAITLDEICKITEMHKPDFIMIDYIQIVRSKVGRNTTERLEHISMELRDLALREQIAVVAIAQLNRDADGTIPKMSNLKGSSQLDQDATHIFLLDRPESEMLKKVERRDYCNLRGDPVSIYDSTIKTNRAALLCSKNRNGPSFYTLLDFNPTTTNFTEYQE
jgi:replicative DNA helicase